MSKMIPLNHNTMLANQDTFNNMLGSFIDDAWFPFRTPDLEKFKLDVKENEDQYTIEVELPGVKKKDITLDLIEGRLTIGVAEKKVAPEDRKKLIHRERRYSYMERSIYLDHADNQNAEAKLEKGELVITIPKVKNTDNTQKIEVK